MIGPPGSGKGTQAKKIAAKYGYEHISTGDLLRALAGKLKLSPLEKEAVEKIKFGKLVSDKLIYQLVFGKIKKNIAAGSGAVLDGAVRNLKQARDFQKFFAEKNLAEEVLALEIALSENDSLNRLAKRRMCSSCGEIIPWLVVTKNLKTCPKCCGKLEIRQDDNLRIIKERIAKQGNKAMAPVVKFYKKLGVLKKVDGNQPIENVEKDIIKVLKN